MTKPKPVEAIFLERGARLRWLRDLTHLTREALCDEAGLNTSTWKGWEIGQHGGLSLKGAKKIVSRVAKEGVLCTIDWLLEGVGPAPYLLPDFYRTRFELASPSELIQDFTDESLLILEELKLFKSHYKQTTDWIVSDDAMEPEYSIGTYIAGVIFPVTKKERLDFALGKPCIVQTTEGQVLFRKLAQKTETGHFNLQATNPHTTVVYPMLYDVALLSIAPVIWQRRKAASVQAALPH